MALYRFRTPDGTVITGQGASEGEALTNAKVQWMRVTGPPGASQNKSRSAADQRAYEQTLARERVANSQGPLSPGGRASGLTGWAAGMAGPITSLVYPASKARDNELANAARRAKGQPTISNDAIYDAARDATQEDIGRQFAQNRGSSATAMTVGLLAGPEAKGLEMLGEGANLGLGVLGRGVAKAPVVGTRMAKTAQALKGAREASPMLDTAMRWGGGTGKAMASGAGTGAVLGGMEGDSLQDRAANAWHDAITGGITGGVLHGVGSPLVSMAAPVAKDVASGFARMAAPNWAKAQDAAKADALAQAKARQVLAQGGLTPETYAGRTGKYAGMGQTVAEAGGPGSVNLLSSVGRREGDTGVALREQLQQRHEGSADDILNDVHQHLGLDPKTAQANVDDMVAASEAKADPLWQHARDVGEGGIWSPRLHGLFSGEFGSRQLAESERIARSTGKAAEAPQYAEVEVPPGGEYTNPETDNAIGGVDLSTAMAKPIKYKSPGRGLSMSQFIAKRGGMNGDGINSIPPDLAVSLPFHGKVAHPNGLLSDEKAMDAAVGAGYYPNGAPASLDHFLEDLKNDTIATRSPQLQTGKRLFAREAPPDDMFAQLRQQLEESNARNANEPTPPTEEDYGTGPAPEFEPTTQLVPTGATLDRVRRRVGKMIRRDETGRPDPNYYQQNEEPLGWLSSLNEALTGPEGVYPELGAAMAASSDNLGMRNAQLRIAGKLFGNYTPQRFQNIWSSFREGGDQLAGQIQLVNDIRNKWGRGKLSGRSFLTPDIKTKLQTAFPNEDVDSFIQNMASRADLAKTGAQMAPGTGSQSAPLLAAGAETDAAAGGLTPADVGKAGLKAATGDWKGGAIDLMRGLTAYPGTAGTSLAMRNRLGDILRMKTDDPEALAFLQGQGQWAPPPPAAPGLLDQLKLNPAQLGRVGSGYNYTATQ
jgi:hypothetical protein